MPEQALEAVRCFWNDTPCGTDVTGHPPHSAEYFEDIEAFRYNWEPEIFSFAQFTRHHGEKMLEIGVGTGTDFVQWVRAGTRAHGIDLTEKAVSHVQRRLDMLGLSAEDLRVANAENLPFPDDRFDLVYSWGVMHHSPDTERCVREAIRVCRPGGRLKLMLYNRAALIVKYVWVRYALLEGRPWRSFQWCLANRMESPGTKAFTRIEVEDMLRRCGISNSRIYTVLTGQDQLLRYGSIAQWCSRCLLFLQGRQSAGFYMCVDFHKPLL